MEIRGIEELAQDLVGKILVVREGNEAKEYVIGSIFERYGLQMKDIHDNPIPFGGNDYELELLAQGATVKWGDMLWEMKAILPVDWEARAWQLACQLFAQSWNVFEDKESEMEACVEYAYKLIGIFKEKATKRVNEIKDYIINLNVL